MRSGTGVVTDARSAVAGAAVCPRCHGALAWSQDAAACEGCDRRYPLTGGIAVLSALAGEDANTSHKRRQIEFFDGEAAEFEITRPAGQPRLYGWLMEEKLRRSVLGVEPRLAGATVLTVCGGSGMDAELLARRGARVIASDLSLGAVQRAVERGRRAGLAIEAVVADAERLPFADRSIDVVYVHDGLHHLRDPLVGLAEMCRVARDCVLVSEPAAAAVTALAVRLGLALEREQAGNRVARVAARQIAGCLREHGFAVATAQRYAMFYRHEPGPWMRLLSRRRSYPAALLAIRAFNAVLGALGNKIAVAGVRRAVSAPGALATAGGERRGSGERR
ncbi:MAG: hypothetical protein QOE31_1938 [Solirubrobacteraceae bacterium]|nr:hypothetical protein [Solirubrobacteraceae bacterium]